MDCSDKSCSKADEEGRIYICTRCKKGKDYAMFVFIGIEKCPICRGTGKPVKAKRPFCICPNGRKWRERYQAHHANV